MKKLYSLFLIVTGLLFLTITNVNAKECHTVYGGGEVCENGKISLDKKVFNPKANEYWDNIAAGSYTFSPEQEVKFDLHIKNISDIKIDGVRLDDDFARLMDYMTYVGSSDHGDFRGVVTDNQIKFDFGVLEPNESVTVNFTARFKAKSELPVGTTCLINAAKVYSYVDGLNDTDYASFCVKTDGAAIITKSTPDTGFNLSTILTLEAVVLSGLGVYALSKSKKISK